MPAPERGNMELANKVIDFLLTIALGAASLLLIMACVTGIVVFGCFIYESLDDINK